MDNIRAFIAVPLPAQTRSRLAEIEDQLRKSGADVKWVPEQNFHITLKFLGNVEQSRVSQVASAVETAIRGVRPFDMTMAGVGAFPKPSRPSVIWVGISKGADELKTLAESIESAMEGIGFAPEERPFSPHITVGRMKTPKGVERLRDMIEKLRGEHVDSLRADAVAVMKSDLRRTGPIYTEIARLELQEAD